MTRSHFARLAGALGGLTLLVTLMAACSSDDGAPPEQTDEDESAYSITTCAEAGGVCRDGSCGVYNGPVTCNSRGNCSGVYIIPGIPAYDCNCCAF